MARGKHWFVYHLVVSWLLYNIALTVALYIEFGEFNQKVVETILAMALFGIGLAAYQWDVWSLYGKIKHFLKAEGD